MAQAALAVWKFNTPRGAQAAAETLQRLAAERVIVAHDAAAVSWQEGSKTPTTHQPSSSPGAIGGGFWGLLFGLIFYVPLLGAAVGAATGAIAGLLSDVGIDDGFMNKVRDQITPGTSALFVMTSDAVVDEVGDAFAGHEPDDLIYTNLTDEQESALREVFQADHPRRAAAVRGPGTRGEPAVEMATWRTNRHTSTLP